jgi:hypothetical protein
MVHAALVFIVCCNIKTRSSHGNNKPHPCINYSNYRALSQKQELQNRPDCAALKKIIYQDVIFGSR